MPRVARRSGFVIGLFLTLGACANSASTPVDLTPVQTAVVQPVTAAPLAAPDPIENTGPTGWAGAQRILNNPRDAGTAVDLYRTLCDVGDTSACEMAAALGPGIGSPHPRPH